MHNKNLTAKIVLLLFVLIGLLSYKEYGIGWDEENEHLLGQLCYKYAFEGNQQYLSHYDHDYGVAFELPWMIIEKGFGITEPKTIFQTRHLFTHLLFLSGAWAIFLLLKKLFNDQKLALIGMLLYLLHPRIYADSFHNAKDIPFASVYAIVLYWSAKAFELKKHKDFLVLGIFTAILINLRIMGILHLATVLLFLTIDLLSSYKDKKIFIKTIKNLFILIIACSIFLYATWPFLWKDPVANLYEVFKNMSQFRWYGRVLLDGKIIAAKDIPWYYFPYWFAITTPLYNLVLSASGIVLTVVVLIKSKLQLFRNSSERNLLLALITFGAPVTAVIIFHSVIYDAWRQLFFVYPPLVILSVYVLNYLKQKFGGKIIDILSFSLLAINVFEITRIYPFHNVYFNQIVNKEPEAIRYNFEQDYWGLSYKQGLDYIVKNDERKDIKIMADELPLYSNLSILFDRNKINAVFDIQTADYAIKIYRNHRNDYDNYKGKEVYSIKVNNSKIVTVFKLK